MSASIEAPSRNYAITGSNTMRYASTGAAMLVAVGVQMLTFYSVLYA
jgi:hypothetical protein